MILFLTHCVTPHLHNARGWKHSRRPISVIDIDGLVARNIDQSAREVRNLDPELVSFNYLMPSHHSNHHNRDNPIGHK